MKTMKIFVISFLSFLLVASFLWGADVNAQRTPVDSAPATPPSSGAGNKGKEQSVCNTVTTPQGDPDPAGCVYHFSQLGNLCGGWQITVLVGCDVPRPSDEKCVGTNGNIGVWCTCYYRCVDQ
jgi:hypothetical protein